MSKKAFPAGVYAIAAANPHLSSWAVADLIIAAYPEYNRSRRTWGGFVRMRRVHDQRKPPKQPTPQPAKQEQEWDEKDKTATYRYLGTKRVTNLDEALAQSEVDLTVWEVERQKFNAWEVTMMGKDGVPIVNTNYQAALWFRRIERIVLTPPIVRPFRVVQVDAVQMWVIIGCVHRPFHNKHLWDLLLRFLQDNRSRISGIIINGDYLDLRSLSTHEEWMPKGVDLGVEYSDGRQGIMELETVLPPDARRIFHYGNHEDRYLRHLKGNTRYGSALPSPQEAMELHKYGYEVQTDWKDGYTQLGHRLQVFHGEFIGAVPAKDHLLAMPEYSCIFNHTHRVGSHTQNKQTAHNIGWLGDVTDPVFAYMSRRAKHKWMEGFGVAYLDAAGNHHVHTLQLDRGELFFEGKVYG